MQLFRDSQGKLPFYYKDEFRAPESLRYDETSIDQQALTLVTMLIEDKRLDAVLLNA